MWKFNLWILLISFACTGINPKAQLGENARASVDVAKSQHERQDQTPILKSYDYDFQMLLGHFEPSEHPDYAEVKVEHADRVGLYLHKDTYAAFIKMYNAAKIDSIDLVIRSATRNFDYQKGIWERKWTGETKVQGSNLSKTLPDPKKRALKILEYSSMPGTSRHHWGSDIDLNNFNNDWFEKGEGLKIWKWLEANAASYGFCRPYTEKNALRPHGYQEERWHWSYTPLANYFMSKATQEVANSDISGFLGDEVAEVIDVVNNYVFGINRACLDHK